jgi:hypothetical protein
MALKKLLSYPSFLAGAGIVLLSTAKPCREIYPYEYLVMKIQFLHGPINY